ncbi:MAG: hypothetical protein AAF368_07090, partial [Planctomycetota bacterium]
KYNLSAVKAFIKQTGGKDDPALQALEAEAERIVVRYPGDSGGACAILFNNAKKLQAKEDYESAKSKYAEMEPSCDQYESALVSIALMDYKLDRIAAAQTAFADYLENYVNDPANAITDNEKRKAYRQAAKAQAQFYLGAIAYKNAASNKSATEADWRAVVEQFGDYYRLYPGQEKYASFAMQALTKSYLALDEFDQARATYDKMAGDDRIKESKYATNTALAIYKALGKKRKATGEDDRATFMDLTRRMAQLLQAGNESDSTPNFGNLRAESNHWMELEDWATAESVLRRIYDRFKDSEAEAIEKHVAPDLGHALLRQNKLAEGYEILKPLATGEAKPSKRTLLDYTRAVLGWVEGSGANPVVVPGAVQDPAAAQHAYEKLLQVSKREESWTADWYPLNFDVLYAMYVRSELDSNVKASAKQAMDRFSSNFLDDPQFNRIQETMDEASPELKRLYGDDLMRRRYLWLRRKLGG